MINIKRSWSASSFFQIITIRRWFRAASSIAGITSAARCRWRRTPWRTPGFRFLPFLLTYRFFRCRRALALNGWNRSPYRRRLWVWFFLWLGLMTGTWCTIRDSITRIDIHQREPRWRFLRSWPRRPRRWLLSNRFGLGINCWPLRLLRRVLTWRGGWRTPWSRFVAVIRRIERHTGIAPSSTFVACILVGMRRRRRRLFICTPVDPIFIWLVICIRTTSTRFLVTVRSLQHAKTPPQVSFLLSQLGGARTCKVTILWAL